MWLVNSNQNRIAILEIRADAPHSMGIGLNRLGLEPFEFKVFKMRLIVLLEICFR